MAHLTVEIDDRELAQLQAAARARQIDPARMTKEELSILLTEQKRASGGAVSLARMKAAGGMEPIIREVASAAVDAVFSEVLRTRQRQHARGFGKSSITKRNMVRNYVRVVPSIVEKATTNDPSIEQDARAKRLAAVMSVHGMWKDDPDKPQDGVEYQREVRAEWR